KLVCSESGKPIGAERRDHGGGVLSIKQPCASAMSRQGLRSAECSQPQPRSMGNAEFPRIVHARPPSRDRASTTRQSTCASMSRRPAAIPAAPAPTTRTSVSLLATGYFAAIWIEPPIVRSQRSPFVQFAPILSPRSQRRQPLFAQTSNAWTLPRLVGGGNVLRLGTLTNMQVCEELPFAPDHSDHCSVRWLRTGRCGAGAADREHVPRQG